MRSTEDDRTPPGTHAADRIGTVVPPGSALGFTLDDALTNGTPDDPSDDLLDAARWSYVPYSLVEDGVRGLGGGLEYAIAEDFCARLLPRFIDSPKPSCEQLHEAIQRAFDRWAADHPVLRFTDATGKITPTLPPAGHPRPWIGFGAEIDFFAFSPAEYPKVRGLGAYTSFWYLYMDPIGTNGRLLPGNTLTSADIVLNTTVCYYLSPELEGRGCNHFESLVLHEIGHALALGHPNEFPQRNFDSDDDPTNEIPIDCQDPLKGLKLSPKIDPNAVMNSSRGRPQPVRLELTDDDLGGRNFLYPICPEVEPPKLPLLLDHTMAKGVQAAAPWEPIEPTYTFSRSDEKAVSWLKLGPIYKSHRVEWRWYSPDGKLYYTGSYTIPDPGEEPWEWYKTWNSIDIRGRKAAELPGEWRVDVYVDGRKLLTEEFVIK